MATISLCMIVKDEESYLPDCLENVKDLVDELIIVDTGSKDATKSIAESFGAQVVDFEWCDDFSKARNASLQHATGDWILVLDADELLDDAGKARIKELIETDEIAFALEQRSYLPQEQKGSLVNDSSFAPIKGYSHYISQKPVRLFRNKMGLHYKNRVHELVEHSLQDMDKGWGRTNVVIHHLGSTKDPKLVGKKGMYYRQLIIQQVKEDPKNPRYSYEAAKMYEDEGNEKMALAMYMNVAKLDPSYKSVYNKIGHYFLKAKKGDAALAAFDKATEHNPDNPSGYNNLAIVLMKAGRMNDALEILESAVKRFPHNEALQKNLEACKNSN